MHGANYLKRRLRYGNVIMSRVLSCLFLGQDWIMSFVVRMC